MTRVNDEQCRRKFSHSDETAKASEQFFDLTIDEEALLLGVLLELTGFTLLHALVEQIESLADILEIGECAADPASCDVRSSSALCLFFDRGDGLVLAADEEHLLAGSGNGRDECFGGLKALFGELKVENVGAVFGTKKEW